MSYIKAGELKAKLSGYKEIAVIDIREGGVHAKDGHILRSISLPISQFELSLATLVPLENTEIIVYDGGADCTLHQTAISKLQELGYTNVLALQGGTEAWKAAGFELFTGTHVIGKAFGELVEEHYETPHVSVMELKRLKETGENVIILDCRPAGEYANFTVPGAIDLPGAELVYRFHEAVKDPDALVVVHCAGRTRSIIGAQALINAGIPNKVASLANGTMDWLLNGFDVNPGEYPVVPAPTDETLKPALESANKLQNEFNLKFITETDLKIFQRDSLEGRRSLYLLDVRSQSEFSRGHLPGSQWAHGGQLVQQIGEWVGTQNARIVLVDSSDAVRASITASWLSQINWGEVFILRNALSGPVAVGIAEKRLVKRPPDVSTIAVADLAKLATSTDHVFFDLSTSTTYISGHIPNSRFVLRTHLEEALQELGSGFKVVLTSGDGLLATFAAADVSTNAAWDVVVLEGGTAAWIAEGHPLEQGAQNAYHPFIDAWHNPYLVEDKHAAFREYLDWELQLVAQLERDGTARFRLPSR
ncbi:rhodanese-like domain-containing protein [Pseudomonas kitaguniensis]|uniref:rhodanese-like domain-containing protein n=1 Tax=Pseudomonas kitaguniensis TaxID=2607908 RepID=UPI003D05CD61